MRLHAFFSDNAALVHPMVMSAVAAANSDDTAYYGDAWRAQLDAAFGARSISSPLHPASIT